MDSYDEYPIRCKTCNEQLACHAETFLGLIATGMSKEEALNNLNIINWCSRISMLSPTKVMFDMENRSVIDGTVSVDQANFPDTKRGLVGTLDYVPCYSNKKTVSKLLEKVKPNDELVIAHPRAMPAMGQGISIEQDIKRDFVEPTVPGVPVNNSVNNITPVYINVGAGKSTKVLNGRTYLAQ